MELTGQQDLIDEILSELDKMINDPSNHYIIHKLNYILSENVASSIVDYIKQNFKAQAKIKDGLDCSELKVKGGKETEI